MKTDIFYKRFSGTGELASYLVDAVTTEPFAGRAEKDGALATDSSYESFSHTKSFEEANSLLKYGCLELQKRIENSGVRKMRQNIDAYIRKRKIYSCPVGFAANVPAYLAGTPNSMINIKQVKQKQRVLNFMYDTCCSCGVSAESIIRAAANVICAIMMIEAGGVRVNLWAGEAMAIDGYPSCLWMVKVKEAGQRLDTLKMSYPIAHPSMLRRHWFRLLETTKGIPSRYVSGYGRVVSNEKERMQILKKAGVTNIHRALNYDNVCGKTPEQIVDLLTAGTK